MPLRALVLNSGPFPRPALPGVLGTTGLSATPGGPAWPSRASGWGHAPTARGFPCCVGSPLQTCRRHYPGGTAGSGRFSGCDPHLPSGCGLPRFSGGSAPTSRISRPARRSLALRPACSRSRLSDPLHRRLRRSRCLHRRSDCYRLERPSCRAGVAPAGEAGSDCTCSPTLLKPDGPAYRERVGLAGLGRLVPALSATRSRRAPMRHAMRRRAPPHPPRPASDSIRPPMSHPFGRS
jgi:hypothetical protein